MKTKLKMIGCPHCQTKFTSPYSAKRHLKRSRKCETAQLRAEVEALKAEKQVDNRI